MRKIISHIMLSVSMLLALLMPMYFTASTFADGPIKEADSVDGYSRNDTSFLGLRTWDYGLVNIDNLNCQQLANDDDKENDCQEMLKSNIWAIVLNVVIDIGIIATYLALGYTIYGGYLYVFSSGDPGKVATGKKTLAQAFIGLAITMSATTIMSGLRVALVGSTGNIGDCLSGSCVKPGDMVTNLINWFCGVAGVAAAIFLVYGGITYSTSAGDPGKVKKAKDMILYSLIGLIIIALAIVITGFVSQTVKEANENALLTNETIIAKEIHVPNQIN